MDAQGGVKVEPPIFFKILTIKMQNGVSSPKNLSQKKLQNLMASPPCIFERFPFEVLAFLNLSRRLNL